MSDELLLVGSIPLDTPEEVFTAFGPGLGEWLAYLPDGEIGDRRYWIDGIAHRVLNGHREMETIRYPDADANGVETWRPQGNHDQYQFTVKAGIDKVRFGDPGWRLGYTRDAINSYYVFRHLKEQGKIPAHVRFQFCIPLTYSCLASFIPDPDDLEKVAPGFTEALTAEVTEMIRHIPASELAIQWDMAIENRLIENKLKDGDQTGAEAEAARVAKPAADICAAIPADVALGYHSCYGTLDGWPSRQPPDAMGTVLLLNAVVAASGRQVDFVHFPTLDAADETFFKPFERFELAGARAYVGAIHHLHGEGGLRDQITSIKKHLPEFGLAAPCGFGRAPERPGRLLTDSGNDAPPDYIQVILDDHAAAVDVLRDVMAG